jgi:glycolate oxidase FAD binding subunit
MRSDADRAAESIAAAPFSTAPVIEGFARANVVAPDNAQAVAELLAEAAERGQAVAPVGGGTALALGNVPERLDLALSTAKLGGVIDYEPTDLVISVGAGARFADVQAVLVEHGQRLPLEAPGGDAATIGGLIATALAGPRRLGSGTLRDLLIGLAVAHPSGTVSKAGGMVVKNVTGYDLTRVYHGSLGTLGVIVSANFKVLPVPRFEATVVARFDTSAAAFAAAAAVRLSGVQPVALEVTRLAGGWLVAARLEGREGTVRALMAETTALLEANGTADAEPIEGEESAAWWRRYLTLQAPAVGADDEVLIRCAVRPRAVGDLVAALTRLEHDDVVALGAVQASPGLGVVLLRGRLGGSTPSGPDLAGLQARLLGMADHAAVLAAPPALKRGVDVWGRPPETLDVMRALKEQFDPARVLNPGRFAGFL